MSTPAWALPTFFIIGAQKSATSTLHRLLQRHPEVFLCDPKEPHFFSAPSQWARGERWYRSLFVAAEDPRAVGEASTSYAMYPHYAGVPGRLVSMIPTPRLIYVLRDPVDRMRSAYRHALAGGVETRPIGQALLADPRYLLTSSYALQLEQWLPRVARQQILLLDFAQLRDDLPGAWHRVLGFLDLTAVPLPMTGIGPVNAGAGKRAPRAWWRGIGAAMLRYDKTEWVPQWMVRLNEGRSPMVRRPIRPEELVVSPAQLAGLRRALRPDLARLRSLWGSEAPAWVHDEFMLGA